MHFLVFLNSPFSVHLRSIKCRLLVHGLNPVDESLKDIGHVLQRAHVQHRKHVRMLIVVGAHQ